MTASKSILTWLGFILIGFGGLMALTNPGRQLYEDFATEQLTLYLKNKICPQVAGGFGEFLESQCKTLVDTSTPQIQKFIADNTQQNNYLLFSIYETDITLPAPLPSYHFESAGLFYNFFIYQADEIK